MRLTFESRGFVDIADGGASHFAETIRKTKSKYVHSLPCLPFEHNLIQLRSIRQSSSNPDRSSHWRFPGRRIRHFPRRSIWTRRLRAQHGDGRKSNTIRSGSSSEIQTEFGSVEGCERGETWVDYQDFDHVGSWRRGS